MHVPNNKNGFLREEMGRTVQFVLQGPDHIVEFHHLEGFQHVRGGYALVLFGLGNVVRAGRAVCPSVHSDSFHRPTNVAAKMVQSAWSVQRQKEDDETHRDS